MQSARVCSLFFLRTSLALKRCGEVEALWEFDSFLHTLCCSTQKETQTQSLSFLAKKKTKTLDQSNNWRRRRRDGSVLLLSWWNSVWHNMRDCVGDDSNSGNSSRVETKNGEKSRPADCHVHYIDNTKLGPRQWESEGEEWGRCDTFLREPENFCAIEACEARKLHEALREGLCVCADIHSPRRCMSRKDGGRHSIRIFRPENPWRRRQELPL
jgi:hypothetical protein